MGALPQCPVAAAAVGLVQGAPRDELLGPSAQCALWRKSGDFTLVFILGDIVSFLPKYV